MTSWALLLLVGGAVAGLAALVALSGAATRFADRRRWLRRLTYRDPLMQIAAIQELAASDNPDAARLLIKELGDKNIAVRIEAARALGAIGDPDAIGPLGDLLGDSTSEVREAAAEALGEIGDPGANTALMTALHGDPDAPLQARVEEALAKIELEPRKAEEDIARFIAALRHDDGAYRRVAADTLLRLKPPEALEALVDALVDADIRNRISGALDEINPKWRQLPYVQDKVKHWQEALHRGGSDSAGINAALRVIEGPS